MIREAAEQDLPAILDIYNDAIKNTTAVWHYNEFTLADREIWFRQKKADGYPILVYEEGGKAAGFATYGPFRPFPGYKYTVEHSVYIHEDFRGRGIGSILLKEIIQAAGRMEYKTMIAGICSSNETSIRLHKKFGFAHAGTIQKAGYKFGKWLDLVFYSLELAGPSEPQEG